MNFIPEVEQLETRDCPAPLIDAIRAGQAGVLGQGPTQNIVALLPSPVAVTGLTADIPWQVESVPTRGTLTLAKLEVEVAGAIQFWANEAPVQHAGFIVKAVDLGTALGGKFRYSYAVAHNGNEIWLDSRRTWTIYDGPPRSGGALDVRRILRHEAGHLFGVGNGPNHSNTPRTAIMSARYGPWQMSAWDKLEIKRVWS